MNVLDSVHEGVAAVTILLVSLFFVGWPMVLGIAVFLDVASDATDGSAGAFAFLSIVQRVKGTGYTRAQIGLSARGPLAPPHARAYGRSDYRIFVPLFGTTHERTRDGRQGAPRSVPPARGPVPVWGKRPRSSARYAQIERASTALGARDARPGGAGRARASLPFCVLYL